ncbi:related to esterase [Serendipita indica DSM 11827]|uniref:Carboxylic ester hydrolase n=1 Tax=Serendipita indica (strain DSM 11827) TaxID=1109443 RepID=G4TTW4_SERID|nr:related to esterase [Serendipita indica DSM 11827]
MVRLTLETFAVSVCLAIVGFAQQVPVVQTTAGKIVGKALSDTTYAYLNVPYAQPPVGPLRFLAPRPILTPETERNGTRFGNSCIQNPVSTPIYSVESEDCLYLNVWTSPPAANKLRPVFMWLYGGAWTSGTASGYFNDLTKWAKARPDIVFVSINYRLNFYGYAESPALSYNDTNAGLRDQRAAVEWVAANIAAFGGDPAHIVLGGQSAGSASVAEYLYAYPDQPLLRGAITMSGQADLANILSQVEVPNLSASDENPFPVIATSLGCPLIEDNYAAQLDCVRTKTAADIRQAISTNNISRISPFVDNQTLYPSTEYRARGAAGRFASVPLLTGTTENEGDFFVINRTTNTLNETRSDLLTLAAFRCLDAQQANYSSKKVSTYRYRYMGVFPVLSPPPLRSWHGSDQIVLFNNTAGLPLLAVEYMQEAWSAFIVEPNDGLLSIGWKKYQGYGTKTLVDIFRNSTDLAHPIQLENPTLFDIKCAILEQGV